MKKKYPNRGRVLLARRARDLGLYLLMEDKWIKVYDATGGTLLATVYRDSWRFLMHIGAQDSHEATDAFDALVKIATLNRAG